MKQATVRELQEYLRGMAEVRATYVKHREIVTGEMARVARGRIDECDAEIEATGTAICEAAEQAEFQNKWRLNPLTQAAELST